MTLEEKSRLSYYQEIAKISDHKNVSLVQNLETRKVFVRKELTVYDKDVYMYLLDHPSRYFPHIYECIESNGILILIEEYIQGQNLEEELEERGTFSEEETVSIVCEVCEALKLLHDQPSPMIHRDLKPSNILRDKNGQIKIVDFDAARNFDEDKDGDTVVMGTHRYAAPEQYGYAQTDPRTDIYALGVTMNRLLLGKYPSEKIYGGKLGEVIRKCVSFDPADRYQSVEELEQALQQPEPESSAATEKQAAHPHLPPGFRTLTWWKILIAVLGYGFLFFFSFSLEVTDASGQLASAGVLWANRLFTAGTGILLIFFWFNYLNVQRVLPMIKRGKAIWIGYIFYTVLIVFVMLILLMITEGLLQR